MTWGPGDEGSREQPVLSSIGLDKFKEQKEGQGEEGSVYEHSELGWQRWDAKLERKMGQIFWESEIPPSVTESHWSVLEDASESPGELVKLKTWDH